jgi:diacylglycerol kinase (ATP)
MGKKIAIVANKLAGGGVAVSLSNAIKDILHNKGVEFESFIEVWPMDFGSFTDVWIVGGDGTLNYFINHYQDIKLPLMIFKGGTGNDFHWLLYRESSLEKQIEIGLEASPKAVDAGTCNGKLFLNGLGVGFDGAVASTLQGKKKKAGKISYLIAILRMIFAYKEQFFELIMEDREINGKLLMINVMNGKRAGGGFYVTPDAEVNDGLFQANVVRPLSIVRRLQYLPIIEKGKHSNLSCIDYFSTSSMHIKSSQNFHAHLDGEYLTSKEIEVEILPAHFLFCY